LRDAALHAREVDIREAGKVRAMEDGMDCVHHLTLGMGAVFAVLIAATGAAQAETQAGPAYIVVELNVEDHEGFAEYAEKATVTVSQYGGSFIVLAADAQAIEGAEPDGFVTILKFDSVEDAQDWLASPEYSAVKGIRHSTSRTRQYLVPGVASD
jgi:uncharacterized protein (DUF1330 family)